MNNTENEFPSRKNLRYQNIIDQVSEHDYDEIEFSKSRDTKSTITQSQSTYIYIRLFCEEELDISQNAKVFIKYLPSGEILETKFIAYGKNNGAKKERDDLVDYIAEDNKKMLSLMVDMEMINYNSEHIPFIRTLFNIGRFYEYQLLRNDELEITCDGKLIKFFDINFG